MLRDIAAFLMATALIQKYHSEPNKVTINTFRDRFRIEIIKVDKNEKQMLKGKYLLLLEGD